MDIWINQKIAFPDAECKYGSEGIIKEILKGGKIVMVEIVGVEKLVPIFSKYIKVKIKIFKLMEVDGNKLESANKHLLVPLVPGERVIVLKIGDGENGLTNQFLQIKHNHGKNISVFHKSYFIPIKKSNEE